MRAVIVIGLLALSTALTAAQATSAQLPAETAGLDQVVRTLLAAFEQVDVVALGEDHGQQRDSDLRIALVRHPGSPIGDLRAEEFLGNKILTCRPPDGCQSVFMGSPLTLGQIADAVVYYGGGQ